ncbi:MAG: 23S rRNA (pseudouridine(1915)-N(3))-methyltransferase RlmH [Thermodesulfovibrionales bacterium]|nr:23S rRNA (pseudouridine(1915)-N(3))-methyltransferase RlmH [Thermodesulfovibrionales bacterium]
MRLRILWVGKTKERFIDEGIKKYLKLLGPFAKAGIVEIKEEKGRPAGMAVWAEGRRILKQSSSYILLDETGRPLSSKGLASLLLNLNKVKACGSLDFVIGGPYGVSEEVKAGASDTLSLSAMTLTHEMARLVLIEQLYRAMTINAGRGYHH